MTITTKTAQKIAPLAYPKCNLDDSQSIYYGNYQRNEEGDLLECFAYVLEKDAIVRFQMDFVGDFTGPLLCEFEVVSMQHSHLKALFSKFLPGMTPVWATENVLWEDDF